MLYSIVLLVSPPASLDTLIVGVLAVAVGLCGLAVGQWMRRNGR
mgnify:CR=1 FL=1